MHIWIKCVLLSVSLSLTACQSFVPKAQGLATPHWQAQAYARQDQVEVEWKDHQFSFLLYQQQQGQNIDFVALSLTGQQLFNVQFNGDSVHVAQRVEQMKLLPFDFVVRDVLYATYPGFSELHGSAVQQQHQAGQRQIMINQGHVLDIENFADHVELHNLQVPYRMVFSPIAEALENADQMENFENSGIDHQSGQDYPDTAEIQK